MQTRYIDTPAGNGRFGASGAVARPKVCADLEVLRPSERQCKPRLRQAALTLPASGGDSAARQRKLKVYEKKENSWT